MQRSELNPDKVAKVRAWESKVASIMKSEAKRDCQKRMQLNFCGLR
jgi:hypothetical protein